MKKALILGGGGFIGGHLAKRLKNDGYYVKICDINIIIFNQHLYVFTNIQNHQMNHHYH